MKRAIGELNLGMMYAVLFKEKISKEIAHITPTESCHLRSSARLFVIKAMEGGKWRIERERK